MDKIKSKYILKDIFTLSFKNMKSVLEFLAYDKVLLNKLDINIKDYFYYKTKTKTMIEREFSPSSIVPSLFNLLLILFF